MFFHHFCGNSPKQVIHTAADRANSLWNTYQIATTDTALPENVMDGFHCRATMGVDEDAGLIPLLMEQQ